MDYLYADTDFNGADFATFTSRAKGDGGLEPGKLVFSEDLERFAGIPYQDILSRISGDRRPDKANLGGPSIVSLIHAAQMLEGKGITVRFSGAKGDDDRAKEIDVILAETPLDYSGYSTIPGRTPSTEVFSDPRHNGGSGERTFVNTRGVADFYSPSHLPANFFDADIVVFGGTALVPRLHDSLDELTARARDNGALVLINTVYDFRNEAAIRATGRDATGRKAPDGRWPLGKSDETFCHIDLLVVDKEEAFRLSGKKTAYAALSVFKSLGVGATIITDGSNDIDFYSDGSVFAKFDAGKLPVSSEIGTMLADPTQPKGDTTGCGDNFVGGVLASMAIQLDAGVKRGRLDVIDACSTGIVSGGFCCFNIGGTYLETYPGEKRKKIDHFLQNYKIQIRLF
jgi:sugar/nucleoside kinase (ribokinase family)